MIVFDNFRMALIARQWSLWGVQSQRKRAKSLRFSCRSSYPQIWEKWVWWGINENAWWFDQQKLNILLIQSPDQLVSSGSSTRNFSPYFSVQGVKWVNSQQLLKTLSIRVSQIVWDESWGHTSPEDLWNQRGASGYAIPQPNSALCGVVLFPKLSRQVFLESLGRTISKNRRQVVVHLCPPFCVSIFGDIKASDLLYLIFNDLLLVIVCILSCLFSFFIQLDQ